ncbi:MAG: CRTAC1 family protein [Candidatus Latescibacteria bacterium]|nr:CRTAC1 family protein [Candidatus Latescibacterota bacterium]
MIAILAVGLWGDLAARAEPPAIPFTDITQAAGIDFNHVNGAEGDKWLPEAMGGGVAFFDGDRDGDADLLLVNSRAWSPAVGDQAPTTALYLNDGGGRFEEASRRTGMRDHCYGMGAAVADYDADGWPDIFLSALGGNRLYRNEGGGYREATQLAGVAGGADTWSTSAGFFDGDNDGDLDLLVANYVVWSVAIAKGLDFRQVEGRPAYGLPLNFDGTYPYFYRNRGDGTFAEGAAAAGLHIDHPANGQPMAKALGLAPVDSDLDGWMDVLVANDTVRNFFFHNQGDGTFTERGEEMGLAYDSHGSATGAMGIDSGYYRDDGRLAFAVGNFADETTSLFVREGKPLTFADSALEEGIGAPSLRALTFGLFFFDADLDGRLDLLQANGHIENDIGMIDPGQTYRQSAQLFWNGGDRFRSRFLPVAENGDLGRPIVGRGAAYADLDGDGDLDVALTQVGGAPLLLRNDQGTGNHWLRLRLVGRPPNRDAIGARVEVRVGGRRQWRQVMPTRSYLSQVETVLTFGLGAAERIEGGQVVWADGGRRQLAALEGDRVYIIEQRAE